MRYIVYLGILGILLLAIAGCGCTEKGGGLSLPGGSKTPATTTATPIPTPTAGHLQVNAYPMGAAVYIEEEYKGTSPMNITDLPNGQYNVSISLQYYSTYKQLVTINGGQTTTISTTLSFAQPKVKIKITNSTLQRIPPCVFNFIGELTNEGDATLKEISLKMTMTPQNSGFKTITKEILKFGDLSPGNTRSFSFDATVLCEGNYRGTISFEGIDFRDPKTPSDDQKFSGSASI